MGASCREGSACLALSPAVCSLAGTLWGNGGLEWLALRPGLLTILFFFLILILFLFIFFIYFISWRLITLQYWSGFCLLTILIHRTSPRSVAERIKFGQFRLTLVCGAFLFFLLCSLTEESSLAQISTRKGSTRFGFCSFRFPSILNSLKILNYGVYAMYSHWGWSPVIFLHVSLQHKSQFNLMPITK